MAESRTVLSGVISAILDEVKAGGNGVNSGTPTSDMVEFRMTFKKHTLDRSNTLSQCKCMG